jgi:8-oxo-dGTP diphosphatase
MQDFKFFSERTICFLLRDTKIILGMKKKGFGKSNYNGFGGGLEPGETAEEAAIREVKEETRVDVEQQNLEKMATIDFYFPYKTEWNQRVHVYFTRKWNGELAETEEMRPEWFDIASIPYDKMWDSDKYWLPLLMAGKRINAFFTWKEDNKTVCEYNIKEL